MQKNFAQIRKHKRRPIAILLQEPHLIKLCGLIVTKVFFQLQVHVTHFLCLYFRFSQNSLLHFIESKIAFCHICCNIYFLTTEL